ncbi:MAG: hypothetical protein JJU37_10035 [Balneolaceae bacterium]|nr:hypothetical protein [Balneolaceae bacterium]
MIGDPLLGQRLKSVGTKPAVPMALFLGSAYRICTSQVAGCLESIKVCIEIRKKPSGRATPHLVTEEFIPLDNKTPTNLSAVGTVHIQRNIGRVYDTLEIEMHFLCHTLKTVITKPTLAMALNS